MSTVNWKKNTRSIKGILKVHKGDRRSNLEYGIL